MALSEDATQLANLLSALTLPDTVAIRNAETTLKPILKDARSVPPLVEVLSARDHQPDAVRHVAGVILRKRLASHYPDLPRDYQQNLKTSIINLMASEPSRTVRNGALGVAAVLCKADVAQQEDSLPTDANGEKISSKEILPWPQLFVFLSAASQDANPEARELAYLLLHELTDTVASYLTSQFLSMAQLFHHTMISPTESTKVKIACLKALGSLLCYLSDEDSSIQPFAALIPSLVTVSRELQMKGGEEDTISTILDVLYELAFCPSPTITTHLRTIVLFALGVINDSNLEMNVRDAASLVIATMAENKSKAFGKDQDLLAQVLDTLFALIENSKESAAGALFANNPSWRDDMKEQNDADEDDEEYDEDAPSEVSMAQGTLDMLACEIPKKFIFQPIVARSLVRLSSVQSHHRKAGVACLGVAVEGCADLFSKHLDDILPHVLLACGDADAQVRECACFALGQISEHCQPDILDYSAKVLPVVFTLLDDSTIAVQVTSCYVIEMFCERLDPDSIRPYLDSLVHKLAHMLETTSKRSVQEMAVAALAATAVAAEDDFKPYISGAAALMGRLMSLRDETMFTLRGRALECMGHIAIAVGKDSFRPYFSDTMKCACEGLTFDSTDLHEFAYALFSNLSKVMESEFSPCLPELVPHLLSVIKQDEGAFEAVEKENEDKNGIDSLADSDDEDEDNKYVFNVRTALIEAKKGAITAIGEIGSYCGPAFFPYLEDSVGVLKDAAQHWHPSIKLSVAEALPAMVTASVAANHNGKIEWVKGIIPEISPLSAHTNAVVQAIMSILVSLMKDEDEETVGKVCEGVQSVIELCGPHSLISVASDCLGNTHALLSKEAPCQAVAEGDVEGDDDDDHKSFMSSVCDLVGAFARVMGSHFVPYLPQFLPLICDFAKSSRPIDDRAMAMGCLGELAEELGSGIQEQWSSFFFPSILAGLADEDDNVKRNSAFCAGMCCQGLGEAAAVHFTSLLQALHPLFSLDYTTGDSTAACVDNAAACVARMIMTSPNSLPLVHVLPIFLKALPLKSDTSENETVYNCILGLLQMNHPDLMRFKGELQRIFLEATDINSNVDDELREKLKLAIPALS